MSPNPDPPKPKNINAALWAKIIGAVMAVILFIAFLMLGIGAAVFKNAAFDCDSFSFLAPAFAVGAAMAAMFLGGGAAVAGNLGEKLQGQALTVSLGGGVAVLVIMFAIFFGLKPKDCGAAEEAMLEFRGIPDGVTVVPSPRLWSRRNSHDETDEHEFMVLISPGLSQQTVKLIENDLTLCSVTLTFHRGFGGEVEGLRYATFDMPEGDSFKLDYALRESGEKTETTGCFTHLDNRPEVELAVALDNRQVRFARRDVRVTPSVEEFVGSAPVVVPPPSEQAALGWSLVAPAEAASLGMPYDELRGLLADSNEQVRAEARRILSQDFARYADAAVADLFAPRTKLNPELLSSLLSGLIAGIEAQTPGLTPAAGRSLNQRLPYIAGRETQILLLASHPDASVRQQARRLIQRFPVDAFERPVQEAMARAERTDCSSERADFTIYAAIFYTYNRMIQAGLDGTARDGTDWDGQARRLQGLADRCIEGVEKVDAALLDYGRALAYAWSGDEAGSRRAVADFQSRIAGREADYYLQGHIERMAALWN